MDKLVIDTEKCNYCGRCAKSCPVDAWYVNEAFIVSLWRNVWKSHQQGTGIPSADPPLKNSFSEWTDAAIQFFDDYANPGERFKFNHRPVGAEKLHEVLKGGIQWLIEN